MCYSIIKQKTSDLIKEELNMGKIVSAFNEKYQTLENVVDKINEARVLLGLDEIEKLEKTLCSDFVSALSSVGAGACIFLGIFGSGKVVGLSAPGITSGLKAIGKGFRCGMKGGLAATMGVPVAALVVTYKLAERSNNKLLLQETDRIYNELCLTLEHINITLSDGETADESTAERLFELRDYLEQAKGVLEFLKTEKKDKINELVQVKAEVA